MGASGYGWRHLTREKCNDSSTADGRLPADRVLPDEAPGLLDGWGCAGHVARFETRTIADETGASLPAATLRRAARVPELLVRE